MTVITAVLLKEHISASTSRRVARLLVCPSAFPLQIKPRPIVVNFFQTGNMAKLPRAGNSHVGWQPLQTDSKQASNDAARASRTASPLLAVWCLARLVFAITCRLSVAETVGVGSHLQGVYGGAAGAGPHQGVCSAEQVRSECQGKQRTSTLPLSLDSPRKARNTIASSGWQDCAADGGWR